MHADEADGRSVRRAEGRTENWRWSRRWVGREKVLYATTIIDPTSARADHDSRGSWRSRTPQSGVCRSSGTSGRRDGSSWRRRRCWWCWWQQMTTAANRGTKTADSYHGPLASRDNVEKHVLSVIILSMNLELIIACVMQTLQSALLQTSSIRLTDLSMWQTE